MSNDLLLMAKPKIVRTGLVAEYRFNERGGQILKDYSGNGYHGRFGSDVGPDDLDPTPDPSGYVFVTVDEQQGDSFVLKPGDSITLNTAITFTGAFTIITVDNPSALTGANSGVYFAGHTTGTNKLGYLTNYFIRVINGGTADQSTVPLAINIPRMTTVVRDASDNVDIYVNKGAATRVLTGASGNSSWNIIGNCNSGAGMRGRLYYQLFYNAALTPAQIAFNFNALQKILAKRGVTLAA